MSTTQKALALAEKRLKIFKRAAMDAQEFGWEIKAEEFWEAEDDSALELIEAALAELRGARPLFVVAS